MKHLLFSTKELGKDISSKIIQNMNKTRERNMYESMLDTLPAAEQAVIRRLLERHKTDTTSTSSTVAPPMAPVQTPEQPTPPTPTRRAAETQATEPTPPARGGDRKFKSGNKVYTIKESQVNSFLKAFPNAVEVNE
jgi:hypothetical protein